MRCIFCKTDSTNSKSVEHIFPESLGNVDIVLQPGIVCDGCNQYFASKVEKPVLEMPFFTSIRHRHDIPNKKNRIPKGSAIIGGGIAIEKTPIGRKLIIKDTRIQQGIIDGTTTTMIIPMHSDPEPQNRDIARFLGKIALEYMASRISDNSEFLNNLIDEPALDRLRNFVRFGDNKIAWNYSQRRIHDDGALFIDKDNPEKQYQLLHEADIILIEENEFVAVINIMGIEFAISYFDTSIDDYIKWLEARGGTSPLDDGRTVISHVKPEWNIGDRFFFDTD